MKSFQRKWEGLEITIITVIVLLLLLLAYLKLGCGNFSFNYRSSGVFG